MQRHSVKRLSTTAILSAAVSSLIVFTPSAHAAATSNGSEWKGTTSSNWNNAGNWTASSIPGTIEPPNSSNDKFLEFGDGWSQTSPLGSTTANDDNAGSVTLNRFLFEPSHAGSGVPDQSFTITSSSVAGVPNSARLLDFGSNAPSISVTSSASQLISMPMTLKNANTGSGINGGVSVTGGSITFSTTFGIETANANQTNFSGSAGKSITFNGLVTAGSTIVPGGTNPSPSRIAITGGEDVNFNAGLTGNTTNTVPFDLLKQGVGTLTFTGVAANYIGMTNALISGTNAMFVDQGTVSIGTGAGSIGTTNGTTTGMIAVGPSGTITGTGPFNALVSIANGSVTVANPIDVRYFAAASAETKTIGGANATGTATYSGTVTLHDSATLTSGAGITDFTGPIAAGSTAFYTNELANPTTPGITVTGSGIVRLSSNSNSYTGPTAINAGTLRVDGSTNSASAVSVGNATVSAATPILQGIGTIGGSVTVSGSGTVGQLSPGDGAVGTLAMGPLTLNAASGLDLDLGTGGGDQAHPGSSDLAVVNGILTLPTSGAVNVTLTGSPTNGWYKIITDSSVSGGNPTFNNTFSVVASPLTHKAYNFVNNGTEVDLDITSLHTATATLSNTLPTMSHLLGTSHPGGPNDINVAGGSGSYVPGYLNNITGGDNGGATGYVTLNTLTTGDTAVLAVAVTLTDSAGASHSLSSGSDPALADIVNDLRATVGAGVNVYEFSGSDAGLTLPAQYASAAAALAAGESANGGKTFDILFTMPDPQYFALDFGQELNNLDGITSLQVTDIGVIPEPTTITLTLLGASTMLLRRRRRS